MQDYREYGKDPDEQAAESIKTGKTIATIARGAATGGISGIVSLAKERAVKRWIITAVVVLLLPVVLLTMLPTVIFGPLRSDGTNAPNGFVDDQAFSDRLTDLNTAMTAVLNEGLTDVLNRIDADFASSGREIQEVDNPYGSDVVYNANAIVSQYCAYKDTDADGITKEEMLEILQSNKDKLYTYTYSDSVRTEQIESPDGKQSALKTVTVRSYTIVYRGEAYFADHVFGLTEEQKELSEFYAANLTVLLGDGVYQGLTDTEFNGAGLSYDGVVFTDGATQVTYYNQLDERWRDLPYGTDHIGGYGCGPTAMSIVVSSLTAETVDPPHMAQWAYEHGYWCSGNGSYHTLIPGAAKAWGLNVEGCTTGEPQRIVDALSSGKLVVAIMGKGHFTKSGHFIVLRGVNSDGTILVADPASYKRSQQAWDLKLILNEAGKRAGAGGPFWILI